MAKPSEPTYRFEFWNGVYWEASRFHSQRSMTWEDWERLRADIVLNYRHTPWRVVRQEIAESSESEHQRRFSDLQKTP